MASNDDSRIGVAEVMDSTEQLIGIYTNPSGTTPAEICITTESLYLCSPFRPTVCLKYKDIRSVTLDEHGPASRVIIVTRFDGSVFNVEVAGGKGKFRDSMAFLHYLDRILSDLRRESSSNECL